MRFPFNLYKKKDANKKQEWDIEHIRSQTDKDITGKDRLEWAGDMLEYFTGFNVVEKQEQFIEDTDVKVFRNIKDKTNDILNVLLSIVKNEKIEDNVFEDVYDSIREEFKESNEPSNCAISNLTLLDSTTNRSYKNAFFPIKRKIILKNDKNGTFIPICTKNVFTKAYSKKSDEIMYWNKHDAEYYLSAMEDTLSKYLTNKDNNEQ